MGFVRGTPEFSHTIQLEFESNKYTEIDTGLRSIYSFDCPRYMSHTPVQLGMGSKENSHNLDSEEVKGWSISDSTEYKLDEMERAKKNWEEKIRREHDILETLSEIDSILSINNTELTFQVSSDDYNQETFEDSGVSEITLRIADSIEDLRDVENNFFQNIQQGNRTRLKNSKIVFEVENPYDESVEIFSEEFSNIDLEIPTMESFFKTRISSKMEDVEHYSEVFDEE